MLRSGRRGRCNMASFNEYDAASITQPPLHLPKQETSLSLASHPQEPPL